MKAGLEECEYRKLSVVQNERNKQVYHFETTLFDLLTNLRRIHDQLLSKRRKDSRNGGRGVNVFHKDVAEMYDGGCHNKNTTVRQAVTVASRLSINTIKAIGDVANTTCPGIILNNGKLNRQKLTSAESILEQYDCRLFRRFLCTSTLRGARNFMNAIKDRHETAQANTVYRARHWSERNDFRSLSPGVLNDLFKLSKLALIEEAKFLKFIGEQSWPVDMEINQENLLRTTMYDGEIESNGGNGVDVLPKLWKCFCRKHPGLAKGIKEAMQKKQDDESSSDDPPPPPPPEETSNDSEAEHDAAKRAEEERRRLEEERLALKREKADKHLIQSNVITHELCFEDFSREVWTDSSKRVDLVLSAIPSDLSNETLLKVPSFCKSFLKTGSYVFLVVKEEQMLSLRDSFKHIGFKVCDHPFTILFDTKTMRKRKSHDFPQRHFDIALIAKTQGLHPEGFVPDFVSSAMSDDADHTSTYASFINVENCCSKLKEPKQNAALNLEERSVQLYSRVIRLLTPIDGSLLDPFGGPLSTCLACLQTGRGCIAMDEESNPFKYSIGRLRVFATPDATMEDHKAYTSTLIPSDCMDTDACRAQSGDGNSMSTPQVTPAKKQRTCRSSQRQKHLDADSMSRTARDISTKSQEHQQAALTTNVIRRSTRRSHAATQPKSTSTPSSLSDDDEQYFDVLPDDGETSAPQDKQVNSIPDITDAADPVSTTNANEPDNVPTIETGHQLRDEPNTPRRTASTSPDIDPTIKSTVGDTQKYQTNDDFLGADALLSMKKSS